MSEREREHHGSGVHPTANLPHGVDLPAQGDQPADGEPGESGVARRPDLYTDVVLRRLADLSPRRLAPRDDVQEGTLR